MIGRGAPDAREHDQHHTGLTIRYGERMHAAAIALARVL